MPSSYPAFANLPTHQPSLPACRARRPGHHVTVPCSVSRQSSLVTLWATSCKLFCFMIPCRAFVPSHGMLAAIYLFFLHHQLISSIMPELANENQEIERTLMRKQTRGITADGRNGYPVGHAEASIVHLSATLITKPNLNRACLTRHQHINTQPTNDKRQHLDPTTPSSASAHRAHAPTFKHPSIMAKRKTQY